MPLHSTVDPDYPSPTVEFTQGFGIIDGNKFRFRIPVCEDIEPIPHFNIRGRWWTFKPTVDYSADKISKFALLVEEQVLRETCIECEKIRPCGFHKRARRPSIAVETLHEIEWLNKILHPK